MEKPTIEGLSTPDGMLAYLCRVAVELTQLKGIVDSHTEMLSRKKADSKRKPVKETKNEKKIDISTANSN